MPAANARCAEAAAASWWTTRGPRARARPAEDRRIRPRPPRAEMTAAWLAFALGLVWVPGGTLLFARWGARRHPEDDEVWRNAARPLSGTNANPYPFEPNPQ